MENVIIIGSGPAGLTASIYLARARLNPLVLAGITWGGQLMTTTEVENFPGFPDGILGPDLMMNMYKQAEKFGSKILMENATSIESLAKEDGQRFFRVHSYDKYWDTKSVIIATGASPRKLGIPGEDKFWAKGVSSCATCDGAFFREKDVVVVGGGDSAMEEANFLTKFASKVYLIHRKSEFRASKIMQEKIEKNNKIQRIMNTEVREIFGDQKVSGIKIFNNITQEESELMCDGFFLAIGHIPITDFLGDYIELDDNGYIKSENGVRTNVDGIFVAGDVEDHKYKQAITAAGAGCKAALEVEKWLSK